MPLLKNGEKVSVAKDKTILKEIDKLTGKRWPVIFRYVDGMYSNNPLNKRVDMPRSLVIPTLTTMTDPETEQQEPLQYYANSVFRPGPDGKRQGRAGQNDPQNTNPG